MWQFETRAIHAGQEPDPATGAAVVPIHMAATFVQEEPGVHKGYEYSRTDNPTRRALEECVASLEEGRFGLAFASGMAAITTVMYLLRPGDPVLVADDVYGGTWRLFQMVLANYGISFSFVDLSDLARAKKALRSNTKMIWIETPTNPYLKILDIAVLADLAHSSGARLAVDNTFASPYFQKPLLLGADIVIHSTTKYLGGHSDLVGGVVVTNNEEIYAALKFHQNAAGMIPSPFDSWLALRGIKTLAVRMPAHEAKAIEVARFLTNHPKVEHVFYPGLPSHPGHDLAKRQMSGFGGMLSFMVKGSEAEARRAVSRTKVFFLAESLGGVESLISHPASMTHATLRGSPLEVSPRLIRLSVGLENTQDLIEDLVAALQ